MSNIGSQNISSKATGSTVNTRHESHYTNTVSFFSQQGHEVTSQVAKVGPMLSPKTNVALHRTATPDLQSNKLFTQPHHFLYHHSISELHAGTICAHDPHETGPGISVSTATDYGLDGPGIESEWGQDFSHMSRPTLGPTQSPVQWVPGLSRG
jgi:hypothetical protein